MLAQYRAVARGGGARPVRVIYIARVRVSLARS